MAEENQYGYDELRWLAKDTHKNRRHAIWWTAGLSLGAMFLAAEYVQRNNERSENPTGPTSGTTVNVDLEKVTDALAAINTSLKNLERPAVTFVSLPGQGPQDVDPSSFLSDIVWLVDGTRRFPVAVGDVLWLPATRRWLTLVGIAPPTVQIMPDDIEVRLNERPPYYYLGNFQFGITNCAEISSEGGSARREFPADEYVEIEVRFFNAHTLESPPGNCEP